MVEREMQELLWNYPEKLLNEQLTKFRWEATSNVGRADLIFKDRLGRLLVVEVKKGILKRGAPDQLLDYFGAVKREFPDTPVELMVVANEIPRERQLALDKHDIEGRAIPEKKFRDIAEEVGYTFASDKETATKSESSFVSKTTRAAHIPRPISEPTPRWSFSKSTRAEGDAAEFLGRCNDEGRAFFSALFEIQKLLANKSRITWKHESGFSMHFYFGQLGFVEMVWGFPAVNRGGKSRTERLVFPFDFASRRGIAENFINTFGEALAAQVPFTGGEKRPTYRVADLTQTETEHVLKTICEFAEKAAQIA